MPTRIATLGRERRIATLARRVYRIEGTGSAESQRLAEAALLRANPRLATPEGFRNGAAIVVPAVRGLELAEAVLATRAAPEDLAGETRLRLQASASRIEGRFVAAEASAAASLQQIQDPAFRRTLARTLPEAEELVATAERNIAQRRSENAERNGLFQEALTEAISAVEVLQKLAESARNSGR
ncbi:hypothetical protein [Algicella marina]|uniref:Uncharacterized protein n=1 Tax=Algicella marina TaxID=2683284 RepID=A0A6P1T177_9RHOB|nr:hypothetical protein [Algicella marina]QHQ36664.1 hypothetical protein GO499_16535 [Algicella marina]